MTLKEIDIALMRLGFKMRAQIHDRLLVDLDIPVGRKARALDGKVTNLLIEEWLKTIPEELRNNARHDAHRDDFHQRVESKAVKPHSRIVN